MTSASTDDAILAVPPPKQPVRYRILLIEDHHVMAQALRSLLQLESFCESFEIETDGIQGVRQAKEIEADLVLMDVQLPGIAGGEATRQIRATCPSTRVLAFSSLCDHKTIEQMFEAGVSGYALKHLDFQELCEAIRTVMDGRGYLPEILRETMPAFGIFLRNRGVRTQISQREREVLILMANGRSTKQIARDLMLSAKTIESHRRKLMAKLKIDNVAELTKYALREGMIAM